MPKIAQYEPNQVTTQVARQPRAQNAPVGAFDNPVAQGVLDVAQSAVSFKNRIDTTSAEEALVSFERDKNQMFFNPDNGYFNTQGRNAYDNSSTANSALDDLKKKYGETLGVQARTMFDTVADKQITRDQLDIARHASRGLKAWEIGTIESQVENTIENASLYWDNPDKLKVQNVLGRQAIFESSKMMGLGFEETTEKVQTYESMFSRSTIEAATQNSAAEGQKAFDAAGKKLEGPDKLKMKALIERRSKIEDTQNNARMATLTATKLVDQYDKRADVIDEVNKIKDPELRKETMTQSMILFSRAEQAEKELANDNYQSAIESVNSGASPIEIEAQNSEAWLGMTDIQRNNILSGKHMITDQILLNRLRSLPTKEKAKLNAVDYAADLKPTDLQKLTGEIIAAKKGKQGSRVKSLASKATLIAEGTFGNKSKWTNRRGKQTDRGKRANEFLNELQDVIDEEESNKERKLTPAEENKIMLDFTEAFREERSLLGLDILAPDADVNLSNTPATHMRVLNDIRNNASDLDEQRLIRAYRSLVDEGTAINKNNLIIQFNKE